MRHISTLAVSLLLAASAWSAPPRAGVSDSGDSALIAQARKAVAGMLVRLPNYTCLETLERSDRAVRQKKFRTLDRVRVEVAYVDGQELYAWPGSPQFDISDLREVITGQGAFGTGDFGQLLRATYRADMPLQLAGKDSIQGRDAWRLTGQVPAGLSHYDVIVPPAKATVAYFVTAWHDAASLDLLRVELLVTDFPKEIPLQRSFRATEYATVRVNGQPIRLPAKTELSMTTRGGLEDRTTSTFSSCHEYRGESKLIFEDTQPESASAAPQVTAAAELPPDVEVQTILNGAVDLAQAARGDPLVMTVAKNVFKNGREVLRAGAKVSGRWSLVRCGNRPVTYCFAVLKTESFTDGVRSGPFTAALTAPSLDLEMATRGRNLDERQFAIQEGISQTEFRNGGLFTRFLTRLPRGYRLIWRTLEVSGGSKP
jgi:hypothetical protein